MAKFVIECPHCGNYAEARSGFFARKKIDCACGHVINIRTDKMSSRKCPHCGNTVVFDQSKGAKAKCPVCHEPINTMAEQTRVVEFSCAQCGVRLQTSKSASKYICPVCDHENDVAERLKSEEIRKDGLASVIKYEGDSDTLVWKHPIEDFNYGSQLIVHESQEVIFFRDGQALDLFGAGRYTLETQQLPMMEKLYKLPTDNDGTFHSEVYYINMATIMGVKWGTDSKVRMFDPSSGLHVELGACGEFNIRVNNSRKLLLKVVGTTDSLNQSELLGSGNNKGIFRAMVMTHVKSYLAQAIRENSISVLEIDERLLELSEALKARINRRLFEYGLEMPEFYVSRVLTPDDDPDFAKMKKQYAEQYLLIRQEQIKRSEAEAAAQRKAVEAQTAAQLKIIGAQGDAEAMRIKRAAEADAYRMQAAAEAEEMQLKGFTYQQQTAREVGLEAMQNGITGGGTGGIGEIASLGVTMGTLGGVIGMTKDAINPVITDSTNVMKTASDVWKCSKCGKTGNTGRFCPDCGAKRQDENVGWTCSNCGTVGITTKFCPHCGAQRSSALWDCPNCGTKGISTNFCPDCGNSRDK